MFLFKGTLPRNTLQLQAKFLTRQHDAGLEDKCFLEFLENEISEFTGSIHSSYMALKKSMKFPPVSETKKKTYFPIPSKI